MMESGASPPYDLSARTKELTLAGNRWSYIDEGGGGPVLFLAPGAVGTGEMFYKLLPLVAGIRLIAVTYPGLSDPAALAAGFLSLMDHLNLRKASLLGSSYGGYWAQHVGALYPERVEKLIFGNTFVDPAELHANPLFDPELIRRTPADDLQNHWRAVIEKAPPGDLRDIQLAMLSGRQSAADLKARLLGVVTAAPIPDVGVPHSDIMIIDCADDSIITPSMRACVRDRYAGARLCSLSTGGHYPHILNPSAVAEHVKAFIGP